MTDDFNHHWGMTQSEVNEMFAQWLDLLTYGQSFSKGGKRVDPDLVMPPPTTDTPIKPA